jgi:hypothetical protein
MPHIPGEGIGVSIAPPHGLDQIIGEFGDIFAYILADHTLDSRWETKFLDRIVLPFPMCLSWDKSRSVNQISCHKLTAAVFTGVLTKICNAGLQDKLTT